MIPINSYLLGLNERSPFNLLQDISNQTIFDIIKVSAEANMNRGDLCGGSAPWDSSSSNGESSQSPIQSPTQSTYVLISQNIPTKSTSTEATGIISDGQNLFVSLNSASTTDYDLMAYDYKDISVPLDKMDTGPGILALAYAGKNLFAVNSSINSAMQRFKYDGTISKLSKIADYKIPWASSNNLVYASKISFIYPHLFIGLKKNANEELLSVDLNKIDQGLAGAIDRKWEFDSSVQDIWPLYDKYQHLLVSSAKEPEISDYCLNCDSVFTGSASSSNSSSSSISINSSPISTFDLFGSLGNVKSLISENNEIYVGRGAGNNELFKINISRDYSSTTNPKYLYDLVNSIDVNDGINSMILSGNKLFVATGKNNGTIQIRQKNDLSKITQTINVSGTIADLECVGDKIYGVGSNYKMNGTTTESVLPIIFELIPENK